MGLTVILYADAPEAYDRLGDELKTRTHTFHPPHATGVVGVLEVDDSVPIIWLVQGLAGFQSGGGRIIGYVVYGEYRVFDGVDRMVEAYVDRDAPAGCLDAWNTTTPGW